MSIRLIVLLAAIGLTPILVAIAIAAADVSRGNVTTVTSASAVYAGRYNGRESVIALVPVSQLPRLRAGQTAEVYVPNLSLRLPGRVVAVASADGRPPTGIDPNWISSELPSTNPDLVPVIVGLDSFDTRLISGATVGVRITVSDG